MSSRQVLSAEQQRYINYRTNAQASEINTLSN
jgi:hypothetical protein